MEREKEEAYTMIKNVKWIFRVLREMVEALESFEEMYKVRGGIFLLHIEILPCDYSSMFRLLLS